MSEHDVHSDSGDANMMAEIGAALSAIFSNEDERVLIMNLRAPHAQIFIDILDQVCILLHTTLVHGLTTLTKTMDSTAHNSRFYAQCLHSLRKICAHTGILPSSCTLSEGLKCESTEALMSGGFADIWRGSYLEKVVALKVLRIHGGSNLRKVKKVVGPIIIYRNPWFTPLPWFPDFLQGDDSLETNVTPKHIAILGYFH